jgi:hypothetical protein
MYRLRALQVLLAYLSRLCRRLPRRSDAIRHCIQRSVDKHLAKPIEQVSGVDCSVGTARKLP